MTDLLIHFRKGVSTNEGMPALEPSQAVRRAGYCADTRRFSSSSKCWTIMSCGGGVLGSLAG
jgi:hypothetical protein